MLALVIILDHCVVILGHRLILEVTDVEVRVMVLDDSVHLLFLKLVKSYIISFLSGLKIIIGLLWVFVL